jgi:hypothetical protein
MRMRLSYCYTPTNVSRILVRMCAHMLLMCRHSGRRGRRSGSVRARRRCKR